MTITILATLNVPGATFRIVEDTGNTTCRFTVNRETEDDSVNLEAFPDFRDAWDRLSSIAREPFDVPRVKTYGAEKLTRP